MKAKKPKSRNPAIIAHSLHEWSIECEIDDGTLKKYLLKADYQVVSREKIPFKAIKRALFGEESQEKLRGMKLVNDERERENLEAQGKIVEWDRVELELQRKVFNPLLSALDAAPAGVSAEWVEKVVKPILRGKIEPPKLEVKT